MELFVLPIVLNEIPPESLHSTTVPVIVVSAVAATVDINVPLFIVAVSSWNGPHPRLKSGVAWSTIKLQSKGGLNTQRDIPLPVFPWLQVNEMVSPSQTCSNPLS